MVPSALFETHANGFFTFETILLVRQAQGRFSIHLPRALVSGAQGLQRGDVAMSSSARVGVGEGLMACSSINFGRPGALLGSSVAFGSGCGQALPGVPRKTLLCSY